MAGIIRGYAEHPDLLAKAFWLVPAARTPTFVRIREQAERATLFGIRGAVGSEPCVGGRRENSHDPASRGHRYYQLHDTLRDQKRNKISPKARCCHRNAKNRPCRGALSAESIMILIQLIRNILKSSELCFSLLS